MGMGSLFEDVLDSLRGRISSYVSDLESLFRREGGEIGTAARTAEEIIGEGGGEARPLTYEDFLRRIRGKRALAEELKAFRGTSAEDELRALREGDLAATERALRERIRGLSGWKKAALAGLGLGGATVGGLALLSYLNNRNQGYPYFPSSPSSPSPPPPPPPPPPSSVGGGALGGPSSPSSPSSPSAPGGLGILINPSGPSSPSSPSSPSASLEADLNKKIFGVPAWVWIIIALVIIALVLYYYYHKKKHKHAG
jgi:hypothetical protein